MSQKNVYEWVGRFCGGGTSLATDFIFLSIKKVFNSVEKL
jgi:hypothetical protein